MSTAYKKLIAPLIPGREELVLSWAERLAKEFTAVADGAYLRQDARLATLLFGPGFTAYVTESVVDELKSAEREASNTARAAFEKARDASVGQHLGRFLSVEDSPDAGIARAARCYDLAVSLLAGEPASAPREELLGRLALDAGVPVLAVPEDFAADRPLDKVTLAWDASREAAHAMRAGLPFLKRAKRVQIVHLGASEAASDPVREACAYLEAHGIAADVSEFQPRDLSAGAALLAHVRASETDLLIMGAFGHPRWVEQVFGGATHDLVRASAVALLLAH